MRKQNLAICDLEVRYAYNLMEYMAQRQRIPFELLVFAEVESLLVFAKDHAIDLLLISERMMCEEIRQLKSGKILILSEGGALEEYQDYPMIYKYQPSDRLVSEVMTYCAKETSQPIGAALNRNAQILGVYSPVRRCGKTCFALTLGQILARNRSVIYLNMEAYAGFERLTGQEFASDLSDVMYFIRQKQGNLLYKLHSATLHLGRMDYLPPAFSAADLKEVKIQEWNTLLTDLTRIGGYDTVILDVGDTIEDVYALLENCTRIYSPMTGDLVARGKIEQYEKLLREMEYEELLERTQYLRLPFAEPASGGTYFLEQLVQGEMGNYVRKLLTESGKNKVWKRSERTSGSERISRN
ncbi:MAG: hypothetical protein Q4B01_10525 [Eubacteriales bacterium]|nr:hypothetical protein [Eubacteriales bacterium]